MINKTAFMFALVSMRPRRVAEKPWAMEFKGAQKMFTTPPLHPEAIIQWDR